MSMLAHVYDRGNLCTEGNVQQEAKGEKVNTHVDKHAHNVLEATVAS